MVDRYLAKLRLSPEQVAAYNPPAGIDVGWLEWEKPDIIVAMFVGSDLHPNPLYRKTAAQLREEVHTTFKNRIVEDNLQTYPNMPLRAQKIETVLEHPFVTSRGAGATTEIIKAAEAATEVHDVEMTAREFKELARPKSGDASGIEPREIRKRRREGGAGDEEVYVMSSGIIDIG